MGHFFKTSSTVPDHTFYAQSQNMVEKLPNFGRISHSQSFTVFTGCCQTGSIVNRILALSVQLANKAQPLQNQNVKETFLVVILLVCLLETLFLGGGGIDTLVRAELHGNSEFSRFHPIVHMTDTVKTGIKRTQQVPFRSLSTPNPPPPISFATSLFSSRIVTAPWCRAVSR